MCSQSQSQREHHVRFVVSVWVSVSAKKSTWPPAIWTTCSCYWPGISDAVQWDFHKVSTIHVQNIAFASSTRNISARPKTADEWNYHFSKISALKCSHRLGCHLNRCDWNGYHVTATLWKLMRKWMDSVQIDQQHRTISSMPILSQSPPFNVQPIDGESTKNSQIQLIFFCANPRIYVQSDSVQWTQ